MSQEGSIELGATLLLSNKYKKKWRLLYHGILIAYPVKLQTTTSPPLSSPPYTALSSSLPPAPARTSSVKSSVAIDLTEELIEQEEKEEEERIRSNIARVVKEQDLNSLCGLGGLDFVSEFFASQRPSQPSRPKERVLGPISFCGFLFKTCKCNGFTILMLLISAGLSFAIGFKQEGPKHGWHDGVAILSAVFLLVSGNSIANFWRERKLLKLVRRRNKMEFQVQRGEESLIVPFSDIMVGDKVFLWPGNEVPAHGLLVSDGVLEVAEPQVTKRERNNPFLKSGSKVIGTGHGLMIVTSLESSMSISLEKRRGSLLESLIEEPVSYIDKVALSISVIIAFVVLIRLVCKRDAGNSGLPEMKGKVSLDLLMKALERLFLRPQGSVSILTGLVTVVILSMQHGMPLVVTFSLMCKVNKVVSNLEVLVNDLSDCSSMGLVTVICLDASGGLISKPMEVSRIWIGEKDIVTNVEESETTHHVLDMLKQGVGFSVLDPDLSLSPICDPLVSWAEEKWGMNMKSFQEKFVTLKHDKLDSDKKGSGILVRDVVGSEQTLHLHWSGAASTILEMCSMYYDSQGARHAMANQKINFGQMIKEMENDGLKSIAFAYKETKVEEIDQDELILLGVIGLKIKHTCQESIKSALEDLRNTSIKIKLVSEDDIMVLKDIACELGIEVPADGIVLEGKELPDLDDKAGSEKMDQALLMGSFGPLDKHRMVECLQKKGHVVAFIDARLMTSNTSDSKVAADVGIVYDSFRIVDRDSFGMSIRCFSALKPIVLAGRSMFLNVQKFIQLQLTITISGLLITLITTIFTGDSPLTAFQLIWVNILVSPVGGLMMVKELTSEEQLAQQPSGRTHRNEPIVTKQIRKNIVVQVLYQVSVSLILEFGGHVTEREKRVRKAMIFNTFLLCQLFNQLNTMQLLKKEVLKIVVESYYFLVALCGCILMQVLVIEFAKGLSDCMRLNAAAWAICITVGAFSWVVDWALKKTVALLLNTNSSSQSIAIPSFYPYSVLPFIMLLVFPLCLIFGQIGINMAFR